MANDCLPLSRDAKIGKVAIYKDALITVCVYFMLCVVDVLYVVVMCSNCILTYSIYVEIRCFLTLHYILVCPVCQLHNGVLTMSSVFYMG